MSEDAGDEVAVLTLPPLRVVDRPGSGALAVNAQLEDDGNRKLWVPRHWRVGCVDEHTRLL